MFKIGDDPDHLHAGRVWTYPIIPEPTSPVIVSSQPDAATLLGLLVATGGGNYVRADLVAGIWVQPADQRSDGIARRYVLTTSGDAIPLIVTEATFRRRLRAALAAALALPGQDAA